MNNQNNKWWLSSLGLLEAKMFSNLTNLLAGVIQSSGKNATVVR